MINTDIRLERRNDPFTHYTASGLLSPADLGRLNAELPARELFRREIKVGQQHRKQYNMWRFAVYEDGTRTEAARRLPAKWTELLDSVLADQFRLWLAKELDTSLDGLPLTVGVYLFGDGDYTTVDNGKQNKAVSFALHLNDHWLPEYGGASQHWSGKQAAEPVSVVYPFGGHCSILQPGPETWHNIGSVDTGGRRERVTMMIEFWQT